MTIYSNILRYINKEALDYTCGKHNVKAEIEKNEEYFWLKEYDLDQMLKDCKDYTIKEIKEIKDKLVSSGYIRIAGCKNLKFVMITEYGYKHIGHWEI